ncbi:MAG: hypothetical protein KatS3mg032_1151 [Cyclobacteriaceae bacterium]|nr:MAG: hypothetical protein KatS3mg032_1151 [Cyclobacteriaceae bacterium]
MRIAVSLVLSLFIFSCSKEQLPVFLSITEVRIGSVMLETGNITPNVPVNQPVQITFSHAVHPSAINGSVLLTEADNPVQGIVILVNNNRTLNFQPLQPLQNNTTYTLTITDALRGAAGESFAEKSFRFVTEPGRMEVTELKINGSNVLPIITIQNVSRSPEIEVRFNYKLNPSLVQPYWFRLLGPGGNAAVSIAVSADSLGVTLIPQNELMHLSRYQIWISPELTGSRGEWFEGFVKNFYTEADETPKFPLISDEELLTLVQHQTFRYFYDFAHPASGMARERNTSGDLVTTGGSGFGIMALIAGVERGFITRAQCLERLDKILDFLETADRFHGVWPHWLNGNTGKVIPI